MLDVSVFGSLLSRLPNGAVKDAYLYSTCKILYIELNLAFEGKPKKKFLVLADSEEPPLFFLINTERRGKFNDKDIPLFKKDYPEVFTNEVSYLHYLSVANDFDFVAGLPPTKEELLTVLRKEPTRLKGKLRIEDAKAILEGIGNHPPDLALSVEQEERIVKALLEYVKS